MSKRQRRFVEPIVIEGARLILRNFSGKAQKYNREGERNFGVLLDEDAAIRLASLGWNVKRLKPDEAGFEHPWLKVKVIFGKYPPTAYLINERGKLALNAETIGQLDWTRITNCDLKVRGYFPSDNPNYTGNYDGIVAQLSYIYVTKEDDYLASKYDDVPEIGGER